MLRIALPGNLPDWYRSVRDAVNGLIGKSVLKDGADIYAGDTAGASYDQAKMQAVMDALEAVSNRLK